MRSIGVVLDQHLPEETRLPPLVKCYLAASVDMILRGVRELETRGFPAKDLIVILHEEAPGRVESTVVTRANLRESLDDCDAEDESKLATFLDAAVKPNHVMVIVSFQNGCGGVELNLIPMQKGGTS